MTSYLVACVDSTTNVLTDGFLIFMCTVFPGLCLIVFNAPCTLLIVCSIWLLCHSFRWTDGRFLVVVNLIPSAAIHALFPITSYPGLPWLLTIEVTFTLVKSSCMRSCRITWHCARYGLRTRTWSPLSLDSSFSLPFTLSLRNFLTTAT